MPVKRGLLQLDLKDYSGQFAHRTFLSLKFFMLIFFYYKKCGSVPLNAILRLVGFTLFELVFFFFILFMSGLLKKDSH
jgi:hypothetical protein